MSSRIIEDFVYALRQGGIRISPAERIDASRASTLVNMASRLEFRAALRATLAKTLEDREIFDAAFESHFRPPRAGGRSGKGSQQSAPGDGAGRGASGSGSRTGLKSEPPARERFGSVSPGAKKASRERAGSRIGEPILTRDRPGSPKAHTEEQKQGSFRHQSRDPGRWDPAAVDLPAIRRSFRNRMSRSEEETLAREIPGMIEQIRLARGRRFGEGPRGRIWIKKTLREALAHGGVPFKIFMKERRPRQPRIILMVDVSFSVARASGFFLLLCAGFTQRFSRMRTYFFVDRLVDATEPVRRWASRAGVPGRPGLVPGDRSTGAGAPGLQGKAHNSTLPGAGIAGASGVSFQDLVNSQEKLNASAPSDYGRAFYHASETIARVCGRDSVLVILGDARANRLEPLPWAFEEMAAACKKVIWLNPEPRALWDTGDSVMSSYSPACDVVCEASDLEGLKRGLKELLRSLR